MPSNFFTRPFGLHPTPQICFPPPPNPPVGNRTWFLTLVLPWDVSAGTVQWSLLLVDNSEPTGSIIRVQMDFPGIDMVNPYLLPNLVPNPEDVAMLGPIGHYVGDITIHWANGSTSHGKQPYDIVHDI